MLAQAAGAYVYDGDGNRVEKTASSTDNALLARSPANILDESNSSGSTDG